MIVPTVRRNRRHMEYEVIIFWLVCFSSVTGLVGALRRVRTAGPGWAVLFLLILAICLAGWSWQQPSLVYASGALWFLFVVVPGLLGKLYFRRFLEQRYPEARRLARIISWLHPADGWRQQPGLVHAVELAQRGELAAASAALERYRETKSLVGLIAMTMLYRISHRWEQLIAWETRHRDELERFPQFLHVALRARGETGDLHGLVELYDRHKDQVRSFSPPAARDLCRLMLFVFCGKRSLAERLFAGSLSALPPATQQFWLATADLAAGQTEAAKRQFEALLPAADPATRLAIERRLAQTSTSPMPPVILAESVIEGAALELDHEQGFGAQPTLFSAKARATQVLILLNLLMFAAEVLLGGAENPDTLYRLGALFRPAVLAGDWWRLPAALFLHLGPLHLALNMVALWVLGSYAEFALGSGRFLLVYLLSGIGAMGTVMAFASGPNGEQMTIGASASVMGLVGATGALMLRGWLREKALIARRRLIAVLSVVGLQTVFDALVPQVSMAGHLSGAAIGFAAALFLRDRLRASAH